MEVQHNLIIHLINMISGKDQNIFRIITFHIAQILINGIGCTGIPFTVIASLIRWKYGHSTIVPIEIPRNADADMCIQPEWLILRQHTNRINSGIDTIAEWKIDNSVLAAKCYRRFGDVRCQNSKSAALTAC